MSHYPCGTVAIHAAGTQVTSGASNAETAIPNDASGNTAKVVRLASDADVFAKPVLTGTACTANDILVTNGAPVLLHVQGYTHIAYLQSDAGAKLTISPVEV